MVMTTPSPQQVGREFVRQYYTVLHEAPEVLHRFYNSDSTFIHGGVDRPGHIEEPLFGQVAIDKKIHELNFKDCHTKIRQVDSQATIGNAVVVQVTGELSNNGEPMRRFMQTFVLVPQNPKKYYVHNDIFRYQDEVYHDNSDSESEEQQNENLNRKIITTNYYSQGDVTTTATDTTTTTTNQQQQQIDNLPTQTEDTNLDTNVSSGGGSVVQIQPVVNLIQSEVLPQRETYATTTTTNEQEIIQLNDENTELNGVDHKDDTNDTASSTHISETHDTQQVITLNNEEINKDDGQKQQIQPQQQQQQQQQPIQSSKSSWANIVNNPTMTRSINIPTTATTSINQNQNQKQFTKSKSNLLNNTDTSGISFGTHTTTTTIAQNSNKYDTNSQNNNRPRVSGNRNSIQRDSQSQRNNNFNDKNQQIIGDTNNSTTLTATTTTTTTTTTTPNDDIDKRFGRFPDNHQIFVGNLQPEISENELKIFFSQYGTVVEVRINSNTKQQSGRRLPNYGFIVFENKESVDTLLRSSNKSNNLSYKNDKGIEYRLNVEEKRARQGNGGGGGGGGVDNRINYQQKSNRGNRSSSNGSKNRTGYNGASGGSGGGAGGSIKRGATLNSGPSTIGRGALRS